MHIYIYIHTYAYTYICTWKRMRIYDTIQTRWRTATVTHNLCTNTHTHTYTQVFTCIRIHIHIHLQIYTYIHVSHGTHIYMHIYTHTRTFNTYICTRGSWSIFGDSSVTLAQWQIARHLRNLVICRSPVRFRPKTRQLRFTWIWANRPSSKGSKLLFPVMKEIQIKSHAKHVWNDVAATTAREARLDAKKLRPSPCPLQSGGGSPTVASSPIARPRGTTDKRRTTTTNSSSSHHHNSAPPRLQALICTGAEPIHPVYGPPKLQATEAAPRNEVTCQEGSVTLCPQP